MRIEINPDSEPNNPERSVGRKISHYNSLIKDRLRSQLFHDKPAETTDYQIQFNSLMSQCRPLLDFGHSAGQWFYDVYAPLEKQYAKKRTWFESKKWLDFVRKRYSCYTSSLIITCEKLATCHHINVLYQTLDQPPSLPEDNIINGYCYVHRQPVGLNDQYFVCSYIFKEAKSRPFILYEDYYLHQLTLTVAEPSGEEYAEPMPDNQPYPVWIQSIPAAT